MPKLSQQASSEPEGDHQQVVSEAGCSEFAGRVLSPEICKSWSVRISLSYQAKSRRCSLVGRQQFDKRYGKSVEHHRDLRPGHANRGVAGELERSDRILLRETGWVTPE